MLHVLTHIHHISLSLLAFNQLSNCRLFDVDNEGEVDQARWALLRVRPPMRVLKEKNWIGSNNTFSMWSGTQELEKNWIKLKNNFMGVLLGTNWTILVLHWTTRPMFCEIYLECDSHLVLGWFSADTPQSVARSPHLRLWRPQCRGLLPSFHRTGPIKWNSL